MKTGFCVAILSAGLLCGCVDYTGDLCIPHADTLCSQDKTYWIDSCQRVENLLDECQCGCRADQTGCRACGEKECESDSDCPQGYWCDRAVWECKQIDCIPNCAARCCGDDGCGGTCPNTCSAGESCNLGSCRCEAALECRTNQDCPQGYWCDRTVWECKQIDCIPNCTGKCCGDDGCGDPCPNNCPPGYRCNLATCMCESENCWTDADCQPIQCCMNGVCVYMSCGNMECGPDPVCGKECGHCPAGYHCDQGRCVQDIRCITDAECAVNECCRNRNCVPMACGVLECGPDPVCNKECGPCLAGEFCDNGTCGIDGNLCPAGQECTDITGSEYYGCIIPPNMLPPENQTGCNPQYGLFCDGNYTCFSISETETVCVENCGACPTGTVCCELWENGPWGCLPPGCSDLPPNPPFCDQYTPCQGNAACYSIPSGETLCIYNCSH